MSNRLNVMPEGYQAIIEQQMHELFPPIKTIQWVGVGSVRVTFIEQPADLVPWDTRFAPFLLNWTFTHDDAQRRVYLSIPANIRRAARGES